MNSRFFFSIHRITNNILYSWYIFNLIFSFLSYQNAIVGLFLSFLSESNCWTSLIIFIREQFQKENYLYDHIPSNSKGIGNIVVICIITDKERYIVHTENWVYVHFFDNGSLTRLCLQFLSRFSSERKGN